MRTRRYAIEELPPLDRFLDSHIEQTNDQSHFLATPLLWAAILRAAGEEPTGKTAWGHSRLRIMRYIGRRYGLPPVVPRTVTVDDRSIPLSGAFMSGWLGMRMLQKEIRPPQVRVSRRLM